MWKMNFFDKFFNKHVHNLYTGLASLGLGALIVYLINGADAQDFSLIILGFPLIWLIRKIYWSMRMKSFIIENSRVVLSENNKFFFEYFRSHAFNNIQHYLQWFITTDYYKQLSNSVDEKEEDDEFMLSLLNVVNINNQLYMYDFLLEDKDENSRALILNELLYFKIFLVDYSVSNYLRDDQDLKEIVLDEFYSNLQRAGITMDGLKNRLYRYTEALKRETNVTWQYELGKELTKFCDINYLEDSTTIVRIAIIINETMHEVGKCIGVPNNKNESQFV